MFSLIAFVKTHRNVLTAFTFLLAAILLMVSVHTRHGQAVVPLRKIVLDMLSPAQEGALLLLDLYHGVRNRVVDLIQLDAEHKRMQDELQLLRPQIARLDELAQENRRLRALLRMEIDPAYKALTARVVGNSSSAFTRVFIVNVGEAEGVRIDAPVMGTMGLLGRVVESALHSSLILTLPDLNSHIPVMVQRSRLHAIATGANGPTISLEYVAKGGDVRRDDVIITSGIGGIFPKGMVVGRVVNVEPNVMGLFQKISMQSAVDFDRVEEVRILLPAIPSSSP